MRRVHCRNCAQPFAAEAVEELPPPAPATRRVPRLDPDSRLWRWLSIPLAAALVIGGLLLIQDGEDSPPPAPPPAAPTADESVNADGSSPAVVSPPPGEDSEPARVAASNDAKLVKGSAYELALPVDWEQVDPAGGATFAASSSDGGADATLWIDENPKLEFPELITRSLRQLGALGSNPRVKDQKSGPTPESLSATLAADGPRGQPDYEVLLRMSGPYRYYLGTTVYPDASRDELAAVELLTESFTPTGGV